jgi:hypothetical protein
MASYAGLSIAILSWAAAAGGHGLVGEAHKIIGRDLERTAEAKDGVSLDMCLPGILQLGQPSLGRSHEISKGLLAQRSRMSACAQALPKHP